MITVDGQHAWLEGHLDGLIRDDRRPIPDDGLLAGVTCTLGDAPHGPSLMMSITRRLYPKRTPTHLHKTDTFRMALGHPLVVGRTSYAHGEFRLQQADSYYGPEAWTDEVGTNQLLIMADRRGGKPYLTTPELQALADMGRSGEEDSALGTSQLPRDAVVDHHILDNLGATVHAGHRDGGFADTSSWRRLADGSRLGVIAFGTLEAGPLFLCWDRPPDAVALPAFTSGTDLVRLVVGGSVVIGGTELPEMGFRLQQQATQHGESRSGGAGGRELWFFASRRDWAPRPAPAAPAAGCELILAAIAEVDAVLARVPAPRPRRAPDVAGQASARPAVRDRTGRGGVEFRLRLGEDVLAPYYVRVSATGSGEILAFSEPSASTDPGDRAVHLLRAGEVTHDVLHDAAHDCWFFRFASPDGEVLFRSLPFPSRPQLDHAIELIMSAAADAGVVDERAAPAPD